ncbi:intermediate filament protein [Ditylenchus destructor]|nr:intermediate filament protein [Ditylenchus destructor]
MQSFFKKPKTVRASTMKTEIDSEHSSHSGSPSNASVGGTRLARKQEKEQLSGLNDRLANYIERVRNLENENAHLHVQIEEVESVERREREVTISRYDSKIADLRKELEQIRHEKTKLEMERNKDLGIRNEYRAENAKLTKKLHEADKQLAHIAEELDRYKAMHAHAVAAKTIAEKENKDLKADLADYKVKSHTLQEQYENEALLRSDIQNQLKNRQEDVDQLKKQLTLEMNEIRKKRHVEISSFTTEVENRYKDKLHEQLKQMRTDFDTRIAENRAEVDDLYQNKLAEASEYAARNRALASEAREEAARYRLKVNELEETLTGNDELLQNLNARIKDLERLLKEEVDMSNMRLTQRDETITSLQNEIARMMSEYQDLMDIKIQLDTELLAYQKLLEGEENRLNINVSRQSNASNNSLLGVIQPTIRRAIKRRRLGRFSLGQLFHTTGNINIDEIDSEGKFVKITNNSESLKSIGGWTLVCVGGVQEVSFKFRNNQTIEAHEAIAVWSNNIPMEHFNGVANIQMKNQVWPAEEAMRAELYNGDKESVAWKHFVADGVDYDQISGDHEIHESQFSAAVFTHFHVYRKDTAHQYSSLTHSSLSNSNRD